MNIYERQLVDGRLIYEIYDQAGHLRGTCFSEDDAIAMRLGLEYADERLKELIDFHLAFDNFRKEIE